MAGAVGRRNLPAESPAQDRFALILQVDNLDAAADELRSKGVQFIGPAKDYPAWGIRAIHLRDPDGNLIEVFASLPESQWTDKLAQDSAEYHARYGASA